MSTALPILEPIITRPIDNTALTAYMECEWKYWASMVQHRRKRGSPGPALVYGTAWHAIMESHYKTGGDVWEAKAAGANAWVDHGKVDDQRTLERLWLAYDEYRKRWGERPELEDAQTLGFPDSPMVELSLNAAWDGALHPYAGKIDRIVEWNGQLYVEDHKTSSQMGNYYFSQFELNNQMMGYAWLAHQLTGRWIAGVRINAHAVLKRENKFAREVMSFSAGRLKDWAENYNNHVVRLENSYRTDVWARNFNACAGKYGMCQYAGVCSLDPKIRNRVLEQDFDVEPWNPLADGTGDSAESE